MAPLTKLLVANRGEIADRVIRTARAMHLPTVAVYSDADAGLAYVEAADEAVHLPGLSPADTYLRGDLLVDAARRTGADAVHPGYGFLSEHAGFARQCDEAGLTFVGPPARVIDLMGSKIGAKQLMAAAGVPVLPSVTVPTDGTFDSAAALDQIGLPILVKASFGGGGRGMRIVRDASELTTAVSAAQREAAAAFGDGTVFLERLVDSPRHIEVQVFGDTFGTVIHLFERECSIQRRHQKVIEEAPAAESDPELRDAVCRAAVAAAKAIGYVNAGTVEFVVGPDRGFWFLEVNTRLQVEHPVTELVTGLDLVELQLRIAAGEPIAGAALEAPLRGHAVEARLYAEDVPGGYLPTSGRVERMRFRPAPGVRIDAGYRDGSAVSTHYDAMLAKVIAWAPTRAEAAGRLATALETAEVHGVTTNRALLVRVLRHPDFLAGRIDTGFLERNGSESLGAPLVDAAGDRVHAAVAGLVATEPSGSPLPAGIPAAWRNVGGGDDAVVFESPLGTWAVVRRAGTGGPALTVDGEPFVATVLSTEPAADATTAVVLDIDGVRRTYRVHHAGADWWVDSPLGSSAFREAPRFPAPASNEVPGSLVAPLPGTVVAVPARPGDTVEAGDVLVAIEAMKMEHPVKSPWAGTVVEVLVAVGDQVDTGTRVAVVEEAPAAGEGAGEGAGEAAGEAAGESGGRTERGGTDG